VRLVGIDFDNTLVAYDTLFHRVALQEGLIPQDLAATKLAVRDYLRDAGREDRWTELQATVYGARMAEAEMYPGAYEFLAWARDAGLSLCIVSHKTRRPFLGPQYDLHAAARAWVESALADERGRLVAPDRVFFELTREEKIARIAALGCDLYVDDLPEVLLDPSFPQGTRRILFDPDSHHRDVVDLVVATNWAQIRRHVEDRWSNRP
jgi:FMN phosphatase YigB (HAD superfamily)